MAERRGNAYRGGTGGSRRNMSGRSSAMGRVSYIEGNTVRKLDTQPKRKPQARPERQIRQHPQKMPASMPGINGASFLFLATVLCTVIFVAFTYIHTLEQLQKTKGEIVSIKSEIAEMEEMNDARYQEITDSVDLSEVYERATQMLNMVQAEDNQVFTYRSQKSDMVKQYADIPGAQK